MAGLLAVKKGTSVYKKTTIWPHLQELLENITGIRILDHPVYMNTLLTNVTCGT